MKQITFYLDFISPYAYLAFDAMPHALMGLSYSVTYKPVLLGSLLAHHGQLGPAEIPAKRDWTYRHVLWQARQQGLALQMPAQHPFNPLSLLRLAVATDPNGHPNRYVCDTLFRHVWEGGADAADTARLAALVQQLAPERDLANPWRCGNSPRGVWRTGLRGGRQGVLGAGRAAHAARLHGRRALV